MLKIFSRKSHKKQKSSVEFKENDQKVETYTFVGEPDLAQELLSEPIPDASTLNLIIHRFAKNNPMADDPKNLIGLHAAIDKFEQFIQKDKNPAFKFYTDLLPKITAWALEGYLANAGRTPKFPVLNQAGTVVADSVTNSVAISRQHLRFLLSQAFFLNTKSLKAMTFGELSFKHLYNSRITIGHERMVCVLSYFYQAADFTEQELKEEVVFKRLASNPNKSWQTVDIPIQPDTATIHTKSMEDAEDPFFTNFANKQMHVGEVIASCTQEEVLFNMAPEAFVGLLLCEQTADHEIIVISNLRRFSTYTGFLDSFRFAGFYPKKLTFTMLVLDAVYQDHWTEYSIIRDLNKALMGFGEAASSSVSTGNWGCGAFGGDTNAKFVQQLCAATRAGCKLSYSTFGDEDQCKLLGKLYAQLIDRNLKVSDLVKLLIEFEEELGRRRLDTFLDFITKRLDLSFK
eukprot:TRINITY_DN10892_c0_g1_i6.p1 TRINITY_DN10892_c0_g1~~TRINITY_DN10892_c0_g1_i6.p1  ORF type:complete len:458 (-),score=122.85 TRINITY_DN10892_c0_g1_i6:632-2005(-)